MRPITDVEGHMALAIVRAGETLLAGRTLERPLVRMGAQVAFKVE